MLALLRYNTVNSIMKFGVRIPSLKKRLAARTSLKRVVRHSMGLKMPRGTGMLTNPKKALYNKVYNKTSISIDSFGHSHKSSNRRKDSLTQDKWNTGNFKSREALLAKAKESDISTDGRTICDRCKSDVWAIVSVSMLFLKGDAVFCQACGRPGLSVGEFNKLRT